VGLPIITTHFFNSVKNFLPFHRGPEGYFKPSEAAMVDKYEAMATSIGMMLDENNSICNLVAQD
jgi:hypothetical protein